MLIDRSPEQKRLAAQQHEHLVEIVMVGQTRRKKSQAGRSASARTEPAVSVRVSAEPVDRPESARRL
jgi:uncharacterized protein YeaC (DUF1315 family)